MERGRRRIRTWTLGMEGRRRRTRIRTESLQRRIRAIA
jgi:hypothetical protein